MNTLSWLLYLADVAGTAKAVGGGVIFVSAAVSGAAYLTRSFNRDVLKIYSDCLTTEWGKREHDKAISIIDGASRVFRPAMIAAAIASLVVVFVPSANTIYAIAASEMGEEVLKSETASKATKALNAWLDQQIAKNGGQQ